MRSVMRTEYVIEGSRVNTVTCRVAPPPLAPGCLLFPDAFEAGSLSDGTCGQRVEQQGAKLAELRVRQDELRRALDAAQLQPPTRQGWPTLPSRSGWPCPRDRPRPLGRLLHTLVHEVQVQGRDAILPVFRVPGRQARHPTRAFGQ